MKKVGVFVCHCGSNIAHSVDCAKVAEALKDFPNVAYSTDYTYMCSEPGQEMIQKAIKEKGLDIYSGYGTSVLTLKEKDGRYLIQSLAAK